MTVSTTAVKGLLYRLGHATFRSAIRDVSTSSAHTSNKTEAAFVGLMLTPKIPM